MPATPQANASKPSSSRKRKSNGSDSNRPTKHSKKIDNYFSQLYPVSSNSKESESQPMPLNDEQKRVLEMVVDEGKNVFFTGAAGTWFIHIHAAFAHPLTDLVFALTRNRKVVTAPSYYCCPQEETREETRCRFCHS